jgi:hypothetical protein
MWGGVAAWGGVGALSGVGARGGMCSLGGVGALSGVAAWGGVGALGGVGAHDGVAARGGVGTLGGISAWGGVYALCRCTCGVCSSPSSSDKPATTLRRFRLPPHHQYSSGLPCLGGQWISSFRKAPLIWGASRPPSSSRGARHLSPPLCCYHLSLGQYCCAWSPFVGATHGSLGHPRRLASHRWAHQRRIPLPGPGHGSCIDQTQRCDCKLATIRHGVKLQMTLHIPVAEAKSTCTPSSRSAEGGILPSQIVAPAAYLSPHLGVPLVTPRSRRQTRSTHTSNAPYPYRAAPVCR